MFFRGELLQAFEGFPADADILVIDHGVDERFFDIFIGRLLGKNLNRPQPRSRIVHIAQCAEQQTADGFILQISLEPQWLGNFACEFDFARRGIGVNDLNVGNRTVSRYH